MPIYDIDGQRPDLPGVGRYWIADNAVGGFHNEPAEFAAGLPVHNKDNAHCVVLNEIAEAAQNVRINRLIRSIRPAVRVAVRNCVE